VTALEIHDAIVPIIGGAVALLAGLVLWLGWRLRALGRAVRITQIDESTKTFAEHEQSLRQLRAEQVRLTAKLTEVDRLIATAVRHVGVVRYDAFREMGGKLSFSVAFLDDRGDGVVLTALNGRDGARAYAKAVADGRSTVPLSDEEKRALSIARETRAGTDAVASV